MNTRRPRLTTQLLHRLARALARHVPAAVAGDEQGVHQARVTSRRLREAVPVLATGLKGSKAGKARRKIRRLTQALGSVRELDVTLSLLNELGAVPSLSRTAVEDVRTLVVAERDQRRAAMLERIDDVNIDKLGRRLASVGAALNEARTEPWRKALAARLTKRSMRMKTAMDEAGHMYDPERLHAVRISAKKLRYGLELAADSGLKAALPHVRAIKRVQDMLGRLHDLQVLLMHVVAVQAEPHSRSVARREALEDLARHVEDQCRHLHGRYVASMPALRDVTDAIRKSIVSPLAHPAPRVRTARMVKMSLNTTSTKRPPARTRASGR